MKKNLVYIFIGICLLNWACQTAANNEISPIQNDYFNMDQFVDKWVDNYEKQHKNILKFVDYKGIKDTVLVPMDSILWENELTLFKNLNINKNAMSGLYAVDTNFTKNGFIIEYKLLPEFEKKSSVKYLHIIYINTQIDGIEGEFALQNLLFKTHYYLKLYPTSYFEIKGEREIRFSNAISSFWVRGDFES